jgi:NAD(P)-dependent dehydrogenase (short-subunit alcohol dehydrogenase family)
MGLLDNKIALITGASRGIGAAVAKAYAREGAHVILVARNKRKLERVDDAIRAQGGHATLLPLDLMDLPSVDKIGPTIAERFGRLDIFVANAGILGTLMPLHQISETEFSRVMDTNLTANFRLIKTLDPLLRGASDGRAIFVSTSKGVTDGRAYWGTYAISKAAMETMVQVYADETRHSTLRVNLIHPGAVRTEMRSQAVPGEDPQSLPLPDDITDDFIALALPGCKKHGEVVIIKKEKKHAA